MGSMERRKGQTFERWLAVELRAIWPDAKRGWQARDGGAGAPDVQGCPPYHFEGKHVRRPNIRAALAQAIADVAVRVASAPDTPYHVPVAVVKMHGDGEPTATMRWSDFRLLLMRAHGVAGARKEAPDGE